MFFCFLKPRLLCIFDSYQTLVHPPQLSSTPTPTYQQPLQVNLFTYVLHSSRGKGINAYFVAQFNETCVKEIHSIRIYSPAALPHLAVFSPAHGTPHTGNTSTTTKRSSYWIPLTSKTTGESETNRKKDEGIQNPIEQDRHTYTEREIFKPQRNFKFPFLCV